MHLCYVDESGNDEVLAAYESSPALVIAGLTVSQSRVDDLIWDYLKLKQKFNPTATGSQLTDTVRYEVKGADLRSDLRSGSRRRRRRAATFMSEVVGLLEAHSGSIDAEIWIKQDGKGVPQSFYPTAIAGIAKNFNAQLAAADTQGLMVLDARTKVKNVPSVNGITTRRFKTGGNQLPRLIESPVFGHSDAHVALQIVDIVASAFLFPMACSAYCGDLTNSAHVHSNYDVLRDVFGDRLRDLEHRYTDDDGLRHGGVVVRDKRSTETSTLDLFRKPPVRAPSSPRRRVRMRAGLPLEE